jgi:GAF domain-containing protein
VTGSTIPTPTDQTAHATGSAETAQLMHLLDLLAQGAPVAQVAVAQAPPAARALALEVATAREGHRHREATLTALVDTARQLASETDPAVVLDAIVHRARTLLHTDLAYLTLYDAAAGDTYMRATDGSSSARFQSVRLALGDGLGGLVAKTHKPYWTADYAADRRFTHTPAIDGAVGEEGIVAICGTPLIVGSHFVGVLFAANRSPRPFTRDEVALLGSLATLAAVTLVQTRALADAEQALHALSEAHDTVRAYAAGVEKAAAAHDRFASLVLAGGGVDDITHGLAELLGGWAVLLDPGGLRRSGAGPAPAIPPRASHDPLTALCGPEQLGSGRLVERDGLYAMPVTAGREHLATLCVGGVPALAEADRRTIERAAVVTALVLLFEQTASDARQSVRNRIVSDLVVARGSTLDRTELARETGFDPQHPACLLVLRPADGLPERALLIATSTATGEGSLVGAHDGDVVALVPGSDPDAAAKGVAARLGRTATATVAGVGPFTGVDHVPAAHDEALRTVRALIALGRKGSAGAAAELGFAGLIVGSDPDLRDYVERVLGPVIGYDARRGTELVDTLDAYFAAGASPRRAASSLHVHVNTVSQRLERVATLLGPRWQHPERALEIQLALRLRRLLTTA